ncbi:hypothetical protein B0T10DRAFT_401348 [Thelonectria olida]|uniref:Uncharacterized protein n=1 Tax=Thelonectria olida TaxID=1576542 RepID=A0A9P9ARR2_9HYPO|nr:hypothetical protein B0T10DRAFT_401348 [Thelonectria olida]
MVDGAPRGAGLEADVYPVHMFDNAKVNHCLLSFIMRFNDVLDPEKLCDALSRLLEIGDWRKLGGRLKLKKDGKFEIHVPKCFSPDHPGFTFTRTDLTTLGIDEHDAACRFPKPTENPSIQPISADFRPFLARADFPKSIKDMIQRDLPQLSLHITSFNDATLVAVSLPHTLMDAMGIQALLKSWSLVLEGREAEVPPVLGARTDLLLDLDYGQESKREDFVLNKHRLQGRKKARFALQFLHDKVRNSSPELRVIFLPKWAFDQLQQEPRRQVTESSKASGENHFISEGDILTAWAARAVALSEPKPRPVTIGGLLDGRSKIPKFAQSEGVYAQNVLTVTSVFIPPEMAKGDIATIAISHRRQLLEQSSEPQIRGWLKTMREELQAGGEGLLLFGPSDGLPMLVNNLKKADYIKVVNFGEAVVRQGEATESRCNPLGTMVMNYNQPLDRPLGWPNCFYVLGKDHADNYWLMGSMVPRVWDKIEEGLQSLQKEG